MKKVKWKVKRKEVRRKIKSEKENEVINWKETKWKRKGKEVKRKRSVREKWKREENVNLKGTKRSRKRGDV